MIQPPRVWLLLGHKAGDNAQVQALANALGWTTESKRMVYRPWELFTNRVLGTTLLGIDRHQSSPLTPPWPDLVITAGRRNEPVARWIRKRSGNNTRLVHLGRPWAPLECFDLIVTTPQYQLPARENILQISLPLHSNTQEKIAGQATEWQEKFAHLPVPRIAVLIGGDSGPFVFTPAKGKQLGQLANRHAKRHQGCLLVTSSARTPSAMFDAFKREIDVPAFIFEWQPDRVDNPYQGYLAIADEFIVTGESMSMLAETCVTGKPLYIFDPSDASRKPWWLHAHNFRYKPLTHRLGMWLGPARMARDVRRMHTQLIESGYAVWLGEEFQGTPDPKTPDELGEAARRVKALFS